MIARWCLSRTGFARFLSVSSSAMRAYEASASALLAQSWHSSMRSHFASAERAAS